MIHFIHQLIYLLKIHAWLFVLLQYSNQNVVKNKNREIHFGI